LSHLFNRRGAVLAVSLAVVGSSLVACSSSKSTASGSPAASAGGCPSPSATAAGSTGAATSTKVTPKTVSADAIGVAVKGAFGSVPTLSVTCSKLPATTEVAVVSKGTGAVVKAGDLLVAHDYGRTWADPTAFQNDFGGEPPDTLPVGTGQISLIGLDSALVGVPVGSRVVVVVPPTEAFATGSTLPTGVTSTDTLVFVFDINDAYAATASASGTAVAQTDTTLPTVSAAAGKPTITIPKVTAPTKLEVTTIVQGTGPAIVAGDEVVSQYVGQIWKSGTEFDSSWKRNDPSAFVVGANQLIPAWDKGLVGVKIGSRVLMVVPPSEGYGSTGASSAGISGTDTLVFVIDVLGRYPSAEGSAAAASAKASPETAPTSAPASPAASGAATSPTAAASPTPAASGS
jgi:peptidylprolyl isomerase